MIGEVIGHTEVAKSRKLHTCWWCGTAIDIGQPYVWWSWVCGGDITRVGCHLECEEAWQEAASGGHDTYYECEFGEHERGSSHQRRFPER